MERKPMTNAIHGVCVLLVPLVIWGSVYFLFLIVLIFLLRFQISYCISKCPRCRKNNVLESSVTRYRCAECRAELKKDRNDMWSRLA